MQTAATDAQTEIVVGGVVVMVVAPNRLKALVVAFAYLSVQQQRKVVLLAEATFQRERTGEGVGERYVAPIP